MSRVILYLVIVAVAFNVSCEQNFQPFQEGDYNFSINGYLDLHSNEQWFRVNPIRQKIIAGADWDSLGVDVTLTRETTGDQSRLSAQLFTFYEDGQDTANFWNYVLMDSLNANEEYTIRVTGEDGQSSYATVRMPDTFPKPVVSDYDNDSFTGLIQGSVKNRIVLATLEYSLTVNGRCCVYYKTSKLREGNVQVDEDGNFSVFIDDATNLDKEFPRWGLDEFGISQVVFTIAVDNGSWPESYGTGSEENAIPDTQNNVEDGLGVVTGLATYTMRVDTCTLPDGSECPISDSRSDRNKLLKYPEQ